MHEEQDPDFVIDFDPELTELLFRHKELVSLKAEAEKNLSGEGWNESHKKILIENLQREIFHIERIIKRVIAEYQEEDDVQIQ